MIRLQVLEPERPAAPTRVALISLTTFCNAHCSFCCVLDILNKPEFNPTDEQIREAMVESRKTGCTTLSFTGGEPTVHPKFAQFCREGRELGYSSITINTNGIKFKSHSWTEEVLAAGLSNIDYSVHGHTAELHDAMVERPGAFEAIAKGARNLVELSPKYGATLGATTVVTAANAPHLKEIAECLIDLGFRALRFKHCFEGAPGADASLVGVYRDSIEPLRAAVAFAHERGAGIQVTHFPLCLLEEEAIFASDLTDESVLSIDHRHETLVDGRASLYRRKDGNPCRRCLLAGPCTKLDERYVEAKLEAALRPIETPAALSDFFARGLDHYDAHHHAVRQSIDKLLDHHGAPALPEPARRSARWQVDSSRRRVDTVLLGGTCDLACPACDCRDTPSPVDARGVPKAVRSGGHRLELRGEASTHVAFTATLAAARGANWEEIWVRTSGQPYLDPGPATALRAEGVHGVIVPLCSHVPQVHDRIAQRPSALVDALRAMRTLGDAGLAVAIEVPLLPARLQDLEALVRLAHRAVPSLAFARFFVPTREQPAALAPPAWEEARPRLERALTVCLELGVTTKIGEMDGIPRCALSPELAAATMGPIDNAREVTPHAGFIDDATCTPCAARSQCHGPTRAYHAVHGARGLTPIVGAATHSG